MKNRVRLAANVLDAYRQESWQWFGVDCSPDAVLIRPGTVQMQNWRAFQPGKFVVPSGQKFRHRQILFGSMQLDDQVRAKSRDRVFGSSQCPALGTLHVQFY